MRTQLLKKLSTLLFLGLALFSVDRATGQLSVGPSGLAQQTFDSAPPASSWSTLSAGPVAAGTAIATAGLLDSAVQTNSSARVSLTLPTSATVPPALSGFAQWNSTGLNLQTRANTNWYTLLMATLRNDTGSNLVSITVSYSLATAAGTVSEEIPGHRVYYSFTGATGTWVRIPAFDSATAVDNSSKSGIVNLGVWNANASLYLLWADDNANSPADEGGYSIDNFAVTAVPPQPGPPVITLQPQSQTVGFPNSVNFIVSANGTVPLFYQWFKDGSPIAGATNSNYLINNATVPDQGSYSVAVSNSLGTATSSSATLTVNCSAGTGVTITSQPIDRSLASGGTISLTVTASGTAPLAYQWYRNGVLIPGATGATFNKVNAQGSDSGLYTVVVKNCLGPVTSRQAVVSVSGVGYVVMGLTNHTWKYEQSGANLGTGWRTNGYNDAAWPSGLGLFGLEPDGAIGPLIRTPLALGSPQRTAYYFRTTFELTNDPSTITLVSSNYIDDGMVIYVNGAEAFRYNMPGGAVQYGTLALAANPGGDGNTIVVSNIPSALLVEGNNLIAVEVHQNSATSTDVAYGMALIANPIAPSLLSITNQPESLTVEETKVATFTVGIQGGPAFYQWYRDGVAIPGATDNPLVIPVVTTNDVGCYHVVVANVLNSVTSAPCATLTVLADTNAPILVEADGTLSLTNVLVTFSELVLPSFATNTANYKITNTLGGTLVITNATLLNGSNVLLRTTASRVVGSNYILIVNNVRDVSPRQNIIAPNSMFPIRTLVPLIALDSPWRVIDPFPPFDVDPGSVGDQWKGFTYPEEANWGVGSSVFWNAFDASVVSGPLGTQLGETPGPSVSTYFRNTFQLRASPGGLQFFLSHLLDDGAVFYLNGAEVYRFNMPSGTIITSTPSATVVGNVVREGPFVLPISSIRQGSNVLAAELHQIQAVDTDKIFGVELAASVQSFVVGPIIITGGPRSACIEEGQPVTFSAEQVGGATFQWQQNNSNIPGATNGSYTIPNVVASMAGAQFRVVVSNATTGVTSSNATLCVTPDVSKPALVGAFVTTNGMVRVSFSEQVSAAAATTSNYRITNSAGANIPITGAALSGGNSNVVLTLGTLTGSGFVLIVSNVQDRAAIPNTISPNPSLARIGFEGPALLLPIAATWKYDQSGTDLGTAWRNVGYNDSAWPSGQALLAVETGATAEPIRTTLTLGNPQTITYYFRSTFTSPIAGTARLRLRMEIDDGAMFYLNGAEILRLRFGAGVNVTYTTLAGGTPAENVFEIYEVTVTNLVAGVNTIAVEVHQSGATSTDIVFGSDVTLLGVDSVVIPQVQITTQPQSRTNAVGTTATFSVTANGGTPLAYQWRRNGVNISAAANPSATTATLVLTNVQSGDNGSVYTVVVSDPISSATSSGATLTVTGGGGTCQPINWTSNLRFNQDGVSATRNGNVTTAVLSWTNPATNSCGSNAVVVLQRALTLGNVFPVPSTLWTNIYTNVFGAARVTNSVNGNEAYYRLRVQ